MKCSPVSVGFGSSLFFVVVFYDGGYFDSCLILYPLTSKGSGIIIMVGTSVKGVLCDRKFSGGGGGGDLQLLNYAIFRLKLETIPIVQLVTSM